MGLAEKIPVIRRLVRNRERPETEEAPAVTQYIIRDSRGNALDMGQFIGRAAQALEASTGDEALRTLREIIRNPEAAILVTGGSMEDVARTGSVLLYQATGGQIVTKPLVEMIEEQRKRETEVAETQRKAARHKGVRGRLIRKTLDNLDPFVEPDGW